MKAIRWLGASVFLVWASSAAADGGHTLKADVVSASTSNGKAIATLNVGQTDGVVPGDKGFFHPAPNTTLGTDGNFEIYKITKTGASATTIFATEEALVKRTSMAATVTGTRTCTTSGARPNFGQSQDVAIGKTPPTGHVFATIMSTDWTDSGGGKLAFTIDKGSNDGVMPTSNAYYLMAGVGAAGPGAVDITWVTKTTAGGWVTKVPKGSEKVVRKLGVEVATCRPR